MVAHLPCRRVQPVLLTDGNQLLPVQVAIPGDAQVLTDLLKLLLDPVWAGGGARGGVQVVRVPEAQLPWNGGDCSGGCSEDQKIWGFCTPQGTCCCSAEPKGSFVWVHPTQSPLWILGCGHWSQQYQALAEGSAQHFAHLCHQGKEPRVHRTMELLRLGKKPPRPLSPTVPWPAGTVRLNGLRGQGHH